MDAGHSQRETRATFHISMTAINSWRQKYKKSGSVKDNPRQRRAKKIEAAKLKAYVESHPDAYLKEIGKEFGCSDTAVRKAFKRLGITRKKNETLP